MPDLQIRIDPTPNPNSLKFTANRPLFDGNKFMSAPADAKGIPLAEKIFEIPGVAQVFLMQSFCSVNKAPGTDWKEISPKVEAAIRDFLKAP